MKPSDVAARAATFCAEGPPRQVPGYENLHSMVSQLLKHARLWVKLSKSSLDTEQPVEGDKLPAIKRYLSTRNDNLPWLFVSERGQPMTRRAVNYFIRVAGERAGLGRVWPHLLRHSAGYALSNCGHSFRLLQDFMATVILVIQRAIHCQPAFRGALAINLIYIRRRADAECLQGQ